MKGSARVLIAVAVIVGLGGLLAGPVRAGTIGPPQSVLSIRPYIAIGSPTGAAVYFQVDSTALCGTDSFRIAMSDAQGPQAFGAHRSPPSSARRCSVARDSLDFTVPGRQSSASAMSASDRSSQ